MNGGLLDDFKNAWNKPNNAVAQIILINVVAFVATGMMIILGYASLIRPWFGLPSNINLILLKPWTLVTHFLVHDGFSHILFNMLWFYWFGRIIQEFLGSKKVISIFVIGALFGAIFFTLSYNLIGEFSGVVDMANLVGASAGVTAIVVAAAVKMPNYTVFLFLIGPVKIKYIAMVSVFLSLIGTRGQLNPGGEFAHLGGAFAGWLYISQLNKGLDIGAWVISFMNFVKSLFKPQPKIKVTHRSGNRRPSKKAGRRSRVNVKVNNEKPAQAEIDAILDKISQSGYESLSKEEKQKLFNASKK